jgi:PKD repeat protein
VTDNDGASDQAAQTVQISAPPPVNQPPVAAIGGPTQGQTGQPLSFSGSGSSDPDGTIASYAWDFGDSTSGSGADVTHSYAAPGSYQVTLTVTDNDGASDQATQTVQISAPANQPPTAAIGGPSQGQTGETLSFSGSGSSDADGTIASYAWDFGDSTSGSGADVTHSYAAAGTYTLRLTVTDNDGASDQADQTVQISAPPPVNQPPTAVISGPVTAVVSQTLAFDAGSSSDADGSIVSYAWSFGDGATANGVSVSHMYTQVGGYQVSLTVTDDDGATATSGYTIQIADAAAAQLGQPARGGDALATTARGAANRLAPLGRFLRGGFVE